MNSLGIVEKDELIRRNENFLFEYEGYLYFIESVGSELSVRSSHLVIREKRIGKFQNRIIRISQSQFLEILILYLRKERLKEVSK